MNEIQQFGVVLADMWRLFEEVYVPILGITFAQLWLGVFVASVSIIILRPLLGIGGQASNRIAGFGKRVTSHRPRRKSSSSEDDK